MDQERTAGRTLAGEGLGVRHDFMHTVLDTVEVGIVACDAGGGLTLFNAAALRFHGLPADHELAPERWAERFSLYETDGTTPLPPGQVPLWRALSEGRVSGIEMVIAPRDLPVRRVRCDGQALRDAAGRVTGAVVAMTDVTAARVAAAELQRAHDALRVSTQALTRSEEQFRGAFEYGPVAVCWLDGHGVVQRPNPAFRRLIALPTRSLLGATLTGLIAPADRERLEVALRAVGLPDQHAEPVEVRIRRSDGTHVWCEVTCTGGTHASGAAYVLVQLADVDARKQRETALEQVALRDSLTGLVNRLGLEAVLADRLTPGDRSGPLTLLFLDLDGFKRVNDTLGHAAGDQVLVEVARRIAETVRPVDTIARLGGDGFVIVCAALDEHADGRADNQAGAPGGQLVRRADALARRLHQALVPPVHLPVGSYVATVSIGIAHAVPGEHPAAVLARADTEMYAHKPRRIPLVAGPGRPGGDQPRLTDLVATAVQEDRLRVVYQPVVDLAGGAIVGVEALVRMLDRTGSLVMPDAFIPVAEAIGSIDAIGRWMLETATLQAARWKCGLPPGTDFAVGVNVSPRQLDDPGLLEHLDDVLVRSGLPQDALVLEITERLLTADSAHVRGILDSIRERGVHLAVDDFGTGYSSVSYLSALPFDIIKIDRSWTSRLARTAGGGAATRLAVGVARLAEATGLAVIAEGIETADECAAVRSYGCGLGQGYLFAKPLTAAGLADRLSAGPFPVVPLRS